MEGKVIITFSGIHIQKLGMEAQGTPTAMDIAVHAGRICRFGGAVWYPLLPHLVFVGMLAHRRGANLATVAWGFLHDAHEIATSDVPRPFKCDCMRREQDAIDERIESKFLPTLKPGEINFQLIKQCDIDACHIEAVQLGVPGFAETELKHSKDYTGRDKIHNDEDDIALFHGIMRSAFGSLDVIKGRESVGVRCFAMLLDAIKDGSFELIINQWAEIFGD